METLVIRYMNCMKCYGSKTIYLHDTSEVSSVSVNCVEYNDKHVSDVYVRTCSVHAPCTINSPLVSIISQVTCSSFTQLTQSLGIDSVKLAPRVG